MPKYTVELTDGSKIETEADNFHVKEGFVTFYCHDGPRLRSVAAYPAERVRGVTPASEG